MTATFADIDFAEGEEVIVLDDVEDEGRTTVDLLESAGIRASLLLPSRDLEETLAKVVGHARAVVADHRLTRRASYSGAEFVAKCMTRHTPAVLLTTYAAPDSLTIRRFRAQIPSVLFRGRPSPVHLRAAIEGAIDEVAGNYRQEREPFRTLVRVEAVEPAGNGDMASVFVPAWSSSEALTASASQISDESGVPVSEIAGRRFMASVNVNCTAADDIYMTGFNAIEAPPESWMSE